MMRVVIWERDRKKKKKNEKRGVGVSPVSGAAVVTPHWNPSTPVVTLYLNNIAAH